MEIAKTFDYIGFYAPDALSLLAGILLFNQVKFLAVYIVFFFLNQFVNRSLKEYIKQPRPSGSRSLVGETYGKGSYGMPSYHSQKIWFVTIFLYLVKQNVHLLIFCLAAAAITMYQRWSYRAHSIPQLAVGAGLGASMAAFAYWISNQYLRQIKGKPAIL
jgi:membrane-associated phospholipid phosphatase